MSGTESAACLFGVITQEIDCLAYFRNRVGHGLAGFAHDEAEQIWHLSLHDICCALQAGSTVCGSRGSPARGCTRGDCHGLAGAGFRDLGDRADNITPVPRVEHRTAGSGIFQT
ncbi:hypothetical protein D3C71_713960 [compost metagenome]